MMARRFLTLLIACLAAGCEEAPQPIAPVATSGDLVVLTVNGPATYFEDAQGLTSGFEYDLATLFAAELKAKATFVVIDNPAKIDKLLRAGQAHFAAATLARHFDFPGGLTWGPSYFSTQHQVVGFATNGPKPRSLLDIAAKRVGVIDESVAEYLLRGPAALAPRVERLPPDASTADLLELVIRGRVDYALVESTRFSYMRRFFPQLEAAFNVGKPVDYAWLVSTVDKKRILAAAGPFFERIRKDGTLNRLIDRYFGYATRFTSIDSETLLERISTHLPKLRPAFEEAELVTGIDWRLIAALGYQESHWEALATSPTGVRGLMMLTDDTADRLGIANRLDARESIVGGARYFQLLKDALVARIAEPDRTWLALAAYNLGIGHLEDARILAQKAGLNPDKWQDVRQTLPRLAEADTFPQLKHGYARGGEAVQLVDNVRNYHDILARMAPREAPLVPADQESSKGSAAGK
jgi:membrane-bound lytic murein transglycosylase F